MQLEKEAAQKRGKKDGKGEAGPSLDLPRAGPERKEDKSEKKAEREAASQAKKISTGNQKIASTAAYALGPLNSLETSLSKVLTKADAVSQEDSAAKQLCQETLDKAKMWKQRAHAAVTRHEQDKGSAGQVEALESLPFGATEVKTLCKQGVEATKELKASFPKREAKAKAAPKEAALAEGGNSAAKRRRMKGP